jgi:signal transduction histidine kinase
MEKRDERVHIEVRALMNHMQRIQIILRDQRRFVKTEEVSREINLNDFVESWYQKEMLLIEEKNIAVHLETYEPIPLIRFNKTKLERVMQCLLKNAIESIESRQVQGRIELLT